MFNRFTFTSGIIGSSPYLKDKCYKWLYCLHDEARMKMISIESSKTGSFNDGTFIIGLIATWARRYESKFEYAIRMSAEGI